MRVLVCSLDLDPCPPANVTSVALVDTVAPELFGITAESVFFVYMWGFGAVLGAFMVGYVLGCGLRLIQKI